MEQPIPNYQLTSDKTCFDKEFVNSNDYNNIRLICNDIKNNLNITHDENNGFDNLTTGRSVLDETVSYRKLKSKHLLRHINRCAILSYEFLKGTDFGSVFVPHAWEKVNSIKITHPDLYSILKRLLYYIEFRHEGRLSFTKKEFIDIGDEYYNCRISTDDGYFSTLILPNNPIFEFFQIHSDASAGGGNFRGKNAFETDKDKMCARLLYGEGYDQDKSDTYIVYNIKDKTVQC